MRAALLGLPLLLACRAAPAAPVLTTVPPLEVPEGEDFALAPVLRTADLSVAVAAVHGALAPHLHARHAETVYVLAGTARLRLGDAWHDLAPGDLVHVPPGVVHAVESPDGSRVLSIFTPPFDGEDRVFVDG